MLYIWQEVNRQKIDKSTFLRSIFLLKKVLRVKDHEKGTKGNKSVLLI